MEEDTVELRMAKIADEFMQNATAARVRAENDRLMADLYERCSIRIRVALQQAPPPTERPANAAVEARRKAVASDGLLAVRISALETCIKRILLENDRDGVRARFDHAREFLAANSAPRATQDGGGKDGGR